MRVPGTIWDPLGPQTEPRMTSHDILCAHTIAGTLEGARSLFKNQGYSGTESHLGLGGAGKWYQWQDLFFQADANLDGNPRCLSIETEDTGDHFDESIPINDRKWTKRQVEELVEKGIWLCSREAHKNCPPSWECHKSGIPPKIIPDSKPGRRGLAYHRQGCDGNFGPYAYGGRVPGGEKWSDVFGKICPGDARIRQWVEVVIPLIKAALDGPPDYDYIVKATKKDRKTQKRFERARRGLASYVNDKVQDGWRVVVIRVKDPNG